MIQSIFQTDNNWVYLLLRLTAGVIVFPYGMQKVSRLFNGIGFRTAQQQLTDRGIPLLIAWLIILGQSLGSIALIIGFLGRVAAGGLFIIFTGAMITHIPDGWSLNWFGKKKGEGIEYFVLLLAILFIIVIEGSGALSIDLLLN